MLKKDKDHKEYDPIVLCSAGIGAGYLNRQEAKNNKFRGIHTKETYTLRNGTKLNLPIYYRNKIYTDEEREKLFIQKIDKGYVWICGGKGKHKRSNHLSKSIGIPPKRKTKTTRRRHKRNIQTTKRSKNKPQKNFQILKLFVSLVL